VPGLQDSCGFVFLIQFCLAANNQIEATKICPVMLPTLQIRRVFDKGKSRMRLYHRLFNDVLCKNVRKKLLFIKV
jgi:hypothetical protein